MLYLPVMSNEFDDRHSTDRSGGVPRSPAEQEELFLTAGYNNVRVDEERKKGWICCVGAKANGTVVE